MAAAGEDEPGPGLSRGAATVILFRPDSERDQVMRAVRIWLVGVVFWLGALAVNRVDDGLLGAGGFLLGLALPVFALGVLVAAAINSASDRWSLGAVAGFRHDSVLRGLVVSRRSCGTCSARMSQIGSLWVCERCDLVGARPQSDG